MTEEKISLLALQAVCKMKTLYYKILWLLLINMQ